MGCLEPPLSEMPDGWIVICVVSVCLSVCLAVCHVVFDRELVV